MNLQTHFYHTDSGFKLALHCAAATGKPVLFFTHGNGFASKMYEPMFKHLVEHFDLVLLDAQGHGDSEHGGNFVGWNRSAELAAAAYQSVMPHYPNTNYIGIGHSFGGVLTALMQANHQLFQRIVLLDPVLFPPSMLRLMQLLDVTGLYRFNPMAKRARQRKQHFDSYQHAFDYFYQRGLFRGWHDEALQAYLRHALAEHDNGLTLKCKPQREAEIFASVPTGLWRQLKQLQGPADLLVGTNSYRFVQHSAMKLQRIAPQVNHHQLHGGHCFMQEQPLPTALLIRRLLQAE